MCDQAAQTGAGVGGGGASGVGTGATLLSPRDLAMAMGVSESSLKRWVDEGRITASRTAGGHRRIELSEALRYIRAAKLPVARPELLGISLEADGGAPATDLSGLRAALSQPDPRVARAVLLRGFIEGHNLAAIADGPVRESLTDIGEAWKQGPMGIVEEHRATEAVISAFVSLRALLPDPGPLAPVAVGCGAPGDPHLLPSLLASAVLWETGYRSVNLGPDLPTESVIAALQAYHPDLLWISISAPVTRSRYEQMVRPVAEAAAGVGARLVVGGRGAVGVSSPPIAGATWTNSMTELAAFASSLKRRTPPSAT